MNEESKRIFLSPPHMSGRELDYVGAAFECNYIAPVGPQLTEFEAKFRETTGFQYCAAVTTGTAAIHLTLQTIGVKPGDRVFASSLTFVGSVSPVTYLGADIVFIDSDRESWNMDPNILREELKASAKRGDLPVAVLPTELYGQPCDMAAIRDACAPYGIPVIADCAESLGAKYGERQSGIDARSAIFSFNGNKIITTSGGGMIASNDEELIRNCHYLATQARQPVRHYEHRDIGYNYRMSNILAAIGIAQLGVLEDRVERKREIFDRYARNFDGVNGITFSPEPSYGRSTHWLTVATVDPKILGVTRDEIIDHLESHNIESRPVWKPLHLQEAFATHQYVGGTVGEELFEVGICLPSGTAMADEDVDRICSIIQSVLEQRNHAAIS